MFSNHFPYRKFSLTVFTIIVFRCQFSLIDLNPNIGYSFIDIFFGYFCVHCDIYTFVL